MMTGTVAGAGQRNGEEDGGLAERDFQILRELIRSELGISLAPAKRVMVETRLRKRAQALGMKSLSQYCRYVCTSPERGQEWPHLTDAITTHKTDFFREPLHFEYLVQDAIPALAELCGAGYRRPLQVWSSACSTGEEPYTTAMVLSGFAETVLPRTYRFRITASDISEGVLATARAAIYAEAAVVPVPADLRRKFLLRSRDPNRREVRVVAPLRSLVDFRRLNLMDRDYAFPDLMDVIFCRNVIIYFDRTTQQQVLTTICRTLRPGGFLFMGHSESLNGLDLPVAQVAPAAYRRLDA